MRVTVKVCGLTGEQDAALAAAAGADFLGFVFSPHSRRCLPVEACAWVREARGASRVGVFLDQSESFVRRIGDEARLDAVQLHGDEPPEMCFRLGGAGRVIKAIPVGERVDWSLVSEYAEVARILFDTATPGGGGSGMRFDWRLLRAPRLAVSFWLAGGLTPGNVAEAVAACRPSGVDVASGVESAPGRKDPDKIRAFIDAVRSVPDQAALRVTSAAT
ncbi:MAG: phosphoribosylanthranilate isomerase [Acidobacteriota bacterium]